MLSITHDKVRQALHSERCVAGIIIPYFLLEYVYCLPLSIYLFLVKCLTILPIKVLYFILTSRLYEFFVDSGYNYSMR